jgi:hypothetical protein
LHSFFIISAIGSFSLRAFRDLRDAREEVLAVFLFLKEGLSFGSADHHVVESSRRI